MLDDLDGRSSGLWSKLVIRHLIGLAGNQWMGLGTTEVAEDPGLNGVGMWGGVPGSGWPLSTRWVLAVGHYLSTRLLIVVEVHVASVKTLTIVVVL